MEQALHSDESWNILIVEDDERLADLTREYLESNGLKVSVVGDGSVAVDRIKSDQPDLVILDLMLLAMFFGMVIYETYKILNERRKNNLGDKNVILQNHK